MPRITALKGRLGSWGDHEDDEPLELTAHAAPRGSHWWRDCVTRDLADAVARDHSCTDTACDIREANEHDFPYVAAALLIGATECDYVERVMQLYGIGAYIRAAPGWDAWAAHHATWGRRCAACGSFTYADDSWEPAQCGNCLATLETRCDVCHLPEVECECDEWGEIAFIRDDDLPADVDE